MVDRSFSSALISQAPSAGYFAITKSDTVDFGFVVRGIYVGGAGDVVAVMEDNTRCTFVAVPAGVLLPILARRVHSTGTSATNMVGLY
jgi:hypothetical protein